MDEDFEGKVEDVPKNAENDSNDEDNGKCNSGIVVQ